MESLTNEQKNIMREGQVKMLTTLKNALEQTDVSLKEKYHKNNPLGIVYRLKSYLTTDNFNPNFWTRKSNVRTEMRNIDKDTLKLSVVQMLLKYFAMNENKENENNEKVINGQSKNILDAVWFNMQSLIKEQNQFEANNVFNYILKTYSNNDIFYQVLYQVLANGGIEVMANDASLLDNEKMVYFNNVILPNVEQAVVNMILNRSSSDSLKVA